LQSWLVLNQCQPKTTLVQENWEVLPEFGIPDILHLLNKGW